MEPLPAERKALLFTVGGVRLALRLSQVREIAAVPEASAEVSFRGELLPALWVSVSLGLPPGPTPFALVTEGSPPLALLVESLQGIVDLSEAEVFQLPARTLLPQPTPFSGAVVREGRVALELAVSALGWAPIAPVMEPPGAPPELEAQAANELLFRRGPRTYAVPIQLLAQVLDDPSVFPVPLAPAAHRGLIYHGRAIHPVIDVAVLYGDAPSTRAHSALLVEAGEGTIAVLADRILPPGDAAGSGARRPSWDALFGDG